MGDRDGLQFKGIRRLPPDPRVMDAIGHNHDLASAVADLVDNSIDADARRVLIRVVRQARRVVRLLVIDDGRGMRPDQIDDAMTVGAGRDYRVDDLGHFGIGLKAAAFSQADSLVVVSKARDHDSAGRRWLLEKASTSFECDVLTRAACKTVLSDSPLKSKTGTVVRLDHLRRVPQDADQEVHRRFVTELDKMLRRRLGIVFHRFLARGDLELEFDIQDLEDPDGGTPARIEPLDPFGYRVPGAAGYPKRLRADGHVIFECHIWTPRSELPNFKFGSGRGARDMQGIYVYRNDRVIQAGGWNNLVPTDVDLQLARVAIEVDSNLGGWRMSPQKTHVEWDASVSQRITQAVAEDGTTWGGYLEDARSAFKRARRERSKRRKTMAPSKGFSPPLRRALGDTFEHVPGQEPIEIRWRRFIDDTFIDIDRDTRTIWLNQSYRHLVNGGLPGSLNDAPLLKAAIYLLAENLFQGERFGPNKKDDLTVLQEILTAGARAEAER